ncbi:caspase-6-like [Mytilus galloprovincialis]|uniref:caspase-6-like n=1 Tax=Mytilus galloprovincialis TaxID=29158 RepID=UPI003F7CC0E4
MALKVYTGKEVGSKKDVIDIFASVLKTASSKSKPTIPTDENEYDCNKRYRGLAVVISNENFKTSTRRKYCDEEIKLMQETFGKYLKFTVITFKDLTAKQINLVLEIACNQTEFHQQSDCFACVLASHGNEKPRTMKTPGLRYRDHCISGVDEDTMTTKSIIETITETEALQDKPKMLFIQACRMKMDKTANESSIDQGHVLPVNITVNENNPNIISDHADKVNRLSNSLFPTKIKSCVSVTPGNLSQKEDIVESKILHTLGEMFGLITDKPKDMIRVIYPPCTDDVLVVYSSASEKESYGREDRGGWMLISLHKAVKEQLRVQKETNRIDILDVLIFMTRQVSNSETFQTNFPKGTVNPKRKATIVFEHCLHKELFITV